MYFEGRELKPYAEPILVTDLQNGGVYFMVAFVDDKLLIPIMTTLAYIGKGENGLLRFQDIESYREGIPYPKDTDPAGEVSATFFECTEDQLNNIFEYEGALNILMQCSLRRRRDMKI